MCTLLTALALLSMNTSPPPSPAVADPFLREYAETRRFQSGRPSAVHPTPDGAGVFFLRAEPKSPVQRLFFFDVAPGQAKEVLTPEALLKGTEQTLSTAEKARLERMRISARGFTGYDLSEDGAHLVVTLSGQLYLYDRASGQAKQIPTGTDAAIDPHLSPDARQLAFVRSNDLFVVDLATGKERALTHGGSASLSHGLAEFVAQEEMGRFSGFWWSPDSKWLAYEEADTSQVEKFHVADVLRPDKEADSFSYPRPGRQNATVRLGIVSAAGGKTTWVNWEAERYPYLATVKWQKGGPLTVLVQDRHQREEVLLAVDPKTGATTPLLTESDPAWIDLDPSFPRWLEDGSGFLWWTERNGGPEVELRDSKGARVSVWVPPETRFGLFCGYDAKGGWLYFTASADPTQALLFRANKEGKPERVKTGLVGPGVQFGAVSRDGSLIAAMTSTETSLAKWTLHRPDGTRVGELPSIALEPSLKPQIEIKRVGKGEGYYTSVLRPATFQKGVKLPVVVYVYGGPGHTVVRHALADHLLPQWIANQGFIVAMIDNRGTPGRGRAWERAIQGDFGTLPLEDQVEALQALGAQIPEMDLNRVGIHGWSFGGYMSALAVLKRGDVFKAAVAGAPVVDWHDYDTHYTERYLGLPAENPGGYQKSSLLTWAPQLQRPLLLIHGTSDDNVYFFHTLKLTDALFRAGRPFELLPLAGFTHMVPDPLVTERLEQRIVQFFKDHL